MYGIGAALDLAVSYWQDLREDTVTYYTDPVSPQIGGDGRAGDSFYLDGVAGSVTDSRGIHFKRAASFLFNQAIQQNDPRHRFLLLYMCLVAQVGGNGEQKYCRNEIGSDIIGDKMTQMYNLRSKYVHGRDMEIPIDESVVHLMMSIIRISTLRAGPARDRIVKLLEARLRPGGL
jgi:hypothetical protein